MKTYKIPEEGDYSTSLYCFIKFIYDNYDIEYTEISHLLDNLIWDEGKEVIDYTGKEEQFLKILEKYLLKLEALIKELDSKLKTI